RDRGEVAHRVAGEVDLVAVGRLLAAAADQDVQAALTHRRRGRALTELHLRRSDRVAVDDSPVAGHEAGALRSRRARGASRPGGSGRPGGPGGAVIAVVPLVALVALRSLRTLGPLRPVARAKLGVELVLRRLAQSIEPDAALLDVLAVDEVLG